MSFFENIFFITMHLCIIICWRFNNIDRTLICNNVMLEMKLCVHSLHNCLHGLDFSNKRLVYFTWSLNGMEAWCMCWQCRALWTVTVVYDRFGNRRNRSWSSLGYSNDMTKVWNERPWQWLSFKHDSKRMFNGGYEAWKPLPWENSWAYYDCA